MALRARAKRLHTAVCVWLQRINKRAYVCAVLQMRIPPPLIASRAFFTPLHKRAVYHLLLQEAVLKGRMSVNKRDAHSAECECVCAKKCLLHSLH